MNQSTKVDAATPSGIEVYGEGLSTTFRPLWFPRKTYTAAKNPKSIRLTSSGFSSYGSCPSHGAARFIQTRIHVAALLRQKRAEA